MVLIVNYGLGNLQSIQNMLKKAGIRAVLGSELSDVEKATRIILPGMGHFDNCMKLFNKSGLRETIERKVLDEKTPVLGICVGLQMMMRSSMEGEEKGLGWIAGETVAFDKTRLTQNEKIPNMGWHEVNFLKASVLQPGLTDPRFYFAHSYHVVTDRQEDALMSATYGYTFTAAAARDNIYGVQFHPEKSHRFGLQLLKNFSEKG